MGVLAVKLVMGLVTVVLVTVLMGAYDEGLTPWALVYHLRWRHKIRRECTHPDWRCVNMGDFARRRRNTFCEECGRYFNRPLALSTKESDA